MKVADLNLRYPGIEWRYTSWQSKVKHGLRTSSYDGDSISGHGGAVCYVSPVWYSPGWLGSGTQLEYEQLDVLRECKYCIRRLGPGRHVKPCVEGCDLLDCTCWCHEKPTDA